MTQLNDIPQQARERIETIGAADLVVGILEPGQKDGISPETESTLAIVREGLMNLSAGVRTTLVIHGAHPNGQPVSAPVEPEAPSAGDGNDEAPGGEPEESSSLRVLPWPYPPQDAVATPAQGVPPGMLDAYKAVFKVSEELGARACGVVASHWETVTPQWIYRLVQPVLELDFDLVTPSYPHRKFESLLNNSLIAPLTRALYGRKLRHPLGPDFGFSGRLLQRFSASFMRKAGERGDHSPVLFATEAICGGFDVCEASLGARVHPPTDWVNLSSLLQQVLSRLFQDVEQNAAFWQKSRGSQPVSLIGETMPGQSIEAGSGAVHDDGSVDVTRMMETYQLGCRDLAELWGIVLPPSTMLELRRLARQTPDQFRMPDPLWARVVYDFALGYRLRSINRDHLLRALTPLYLAWVASYALETEAFDALATEHRLEHLSVAFEKEKPYFVARWRWPDRFNP